ncbi:homoserine kinase type II [Streptomyces sp. 2333.5]|uniref:phosphotransferase n=1 Tax=Streptomyces TaxID=1883 RepID=UPI000896CB44|nr:MULTISPECIES: phosphotransferase [unclassified Streptomyces]PJJ03110.1 homoserine kinase type II [Streptomyces sp. 2333.5]SED57910.1 homoserine kinase type II [Streptomyces sp. 2314.4]SEE30949.1 homoserine kinase type II [Streptomyces sp. 2112.2]SOE12538.1 homoserine kinase type II [Streptomyces sp. 2323.1]
MLRSSVVRTAATPDKDTLGALLRHYTDAGAPLSCEPVAEGLLNHGYFLATTRGRYFLKHHLDGDRAALTRQHRATRRLAALGLPVVPPLADADGRTVTVLDGRCYALHPWVEGRHLGGAALTRGQSWRLGALLGLVHTALEQAMADEPHPPRLPCADAGADPERTFETIEELLALARGARPRTSFDELAEHRLLERRALLAELAHHRPAPGAEPPAGWVHGDFHPLNVLYRGAEPTAIVDWDRLGVQPRAEEAVRAAAIFFVRPCGTLDLAKVAAYAGAYRSACGAGAEELAAAVHRVWWERLNDFWMLTWRYQLGDRRTDAQFPAAAALAVWWTREYRAVRNAFTR